MIIHFLGTSYDICSGLWRVYSFGVPESLWNQPKEMVKACQTRRVFGEAPAAYVQLLSSEVRTKLWVILRKNT